MLRSPSFRPVPMPPPMPTELAVGPVVTHDTNTLEGLLTLTVTYARVLGRLARANQDNNYGKIRKYTESRNWLQKRFTDLLHASPADRDRIQASLTGENELDEENGSPTYGYGVVERELLAATHGQIFQLVVKLLELAPETSSDEAMTETHEERLQRHRDSEQCEVSDPDLWATIQYGPPEDEQERGNEDDAMDVTRDGLMEF